MSASSSENVKVGNMDVVGQPGPGSGASTGGEAWTRDPKSLTPTDLYGSTGNSKSRSRSRNRRHSTSFSAHTDNSGQQRPPVRTHHPSTSRDDLSLISVSNGSDVRGPSSRDMLATPPQGAGMYPPRNRYIVRLPPLTKR